MTKNIHSENRQEIVNFLRADMLGPSNLTKFIEFSDLDTTNEVHFKNEEERFKCFLDLETLTTEVAFVFFKSWMESSIKFFGLNGQVGNKIVIISGM